MFFLFLPKKTRCNTKKTHCNTKKNHRKKLFTKIKTTEKMGKLNSLIDDDRSAFLDKENNCISFRVSPSFHSAIIEMAGEMDMSKSDFIKYAIGQVEFNRVAKKNLVISENNCNSLKAQNEKLSQENDVLLVAKNKLEAIERAFTPAFQKTQNMAKNKQLPTAFKNADISSVDKFIIQLAKNIKDK